MWGHRRLLKVSLETDDDLIDMEENRDVLTRMYQMQSRANAGGNVLVTPSTPDSPMGTLVAGNAETPRGDFLDPEVKHFLLGQRCQELVEFDSSWLHVGHINDLMAFIPNPASDSDARFALLRPSSALAVRLLQKLKTQHLAGRPAGDQWSADDAPGARRTRLMTAGSFPVTQLFRGKLWREELRPITGHNPWPAYHFPPQHYLELAENYAQAPGNRRFGFRHEYINGAHGLLHFSAATTVMECLFIGEGHNLKLETARLLPLQSALKDAFPRSPVAALPTFFDIPRRGLTAPLTPNGINLRFLRGSLLMPRPYGPRLHPSHLLSTLRAVIEEAQEDRLAEGHDESILGSIEASELLPLLDEGFLNDLSTEKYTVWISDFPVGARRSPNHLVEIDQIVEWFEDGFPDLSKDDVRDRLREANPDTLGRSSVRSTDNHLKLTIPDPTIDLFEAYTQLLARYLGVRVQWIDTWYAHQGRGGMHSTSFVMRKPHGAFVDGYKEALRTNYQSVSQAHP